MPGRVLLQQRASICSDVPRAFRGRIFRVQVRGLVAPLLRGGIHAAPRRELLALAFLHELHSTPSVTMRLHPRYSSWIFKHLPRIPLEVTVWPVLRALESHRNSGMLSHGKLWVWRSLALGSSLSGKLLEEAGTYWGLEVEQTFWNAWRGDARSYLNPHTRDLLH